MENYLELFEWLLNRPKRKTSIEKLKEIMSQVNSPELTIETIHVAGTNGKGSTLNYINEILITSGYKVGLFTSPHLSKVNERIKVNNENISDNDFIKIVIKHLKLIEDNNLSYFEVLMFISLIYFNQQGVDFALYEVGLGGTFDPTNIITPIVSLITNISLDHTEILGDNIVDIASQKAGIIKPNIPVITTETNLAVIEVFTNVAHNNDSVLKIISNTKVFPYELSMLGHHQERNALLALEAIELLKDKNYIIDNNAIKDGFKNAKWAGRFEQVYDMPLIYIDGAHNLAGIDSLVETITGKFKTSNISILFSALKSKEYNDMINKLTEISDDVWITSFDYHNAIDLKDIDYKNKCESYQTYIINHINNEKNPLIITGSLYFISEVRNYILEVL